MSITRQQVEHVADLARLRLEEEELERMTAQLDAILAHMEQLREVDTTGVQPTTHAMELFNVFREDQIRPSMGQQEALANAPKRSGESFQVPRVIE